MFTASFAKALAERVLTAFAVSLISVLFVGAEVMDIRQVQWGQALGIAGGAALLSLLKGLIAGTGVIGPRGSPSLVRDPAAANPTAAATLTGPNLHAQHQENLERLRPEFGPSNVRRVPGTSGNYTTGGYPGGDGGGEPLPPPSG